MKKLILTTTALVATAGMASAEIALSGTAQMGIQGGSGGATTQFVQDIDITFTMVGTADNGTTFGAAIDLDENAGAVGTNDAGVTIFISGDYGTLAMGDTDGALDWAMQEVDLNAAGSINDDHTTHRGFNGNGGLDGHFDGQILRYDYSFGDFAVALSVEMDDNTSTLANNEVGFGNYAVLGGGTPNTTADPIWGIGARYSGAFAGGTFGVGLGYQFTRDAIDRDPGLIQMAILGFSAHVALTSGFTAVVNHSIYDMDVFGLTMADGYHTGVGASYTFDAVTLHANYGVIEWESESPAGDVEGYGLSAAYDFGGGLSANVGYGWSDVTLNGGGGFFGAPPPPTGTTSTWSLGLSMSF